MKYTVVTTLEVTEILSGETISEKEILDVNNRVVSEIAECNLPADNVLVTKRKVFVHDEEASK